MRIAIKVTPRASNNEIVGWSNHVLRVRVREVPERGRANHAVERLLAKALGVSASSVQVIAGRASSRKLVEIEGLDADEVQRRIGHDGPSILRTERGGSRSNGEG